MKVSNERAEKPIIWGKEFLREFAIKILESSHDIIVVTDEKGYITYLNPSAEKLCGYKAEELIGKPLSFLYKNPEELFKSIERIKEKGVDDPYEAAIIDRSGQERILLVSRTPLKDDNGRLIGFVSNSRDITEEKLARDELIEMKEFAEQILSSAHDIISVSDLDGLVLYINKAGEEILGYKKEEMLGKDISQFYQDPELNKKRLEYIKSTGKSVSYEATVIDKFGEKHVLSVNKAPLKNSTGEIIGFVAVSRDITKRIKAEEKVQELHEIFCQTSSSLLEPYLIKKSVKEIISPNPVFCKIYEKIPRVVDKIIRNDVPFLPVVDDFQRVVGTISLKDMAKGRLLLMDGWREKCAGDFMRKDIVIISPDSLFFDALTRMVQEKIEGLIVQDGDFLVGIVTFSDLFKYQGTSIFNLIDSIEAEEDIENFIQYRAHINHLIQTLLTEGALASQLCNIITEFNDRITQKIIKIIEDDMGHPPVPYAWLGLGSEGRREQTLLTDQDNAILIDRNSSSDDVKEYFRLFTKRVVDALFKSGYPYCKGGIMASEPTWQGEPSIWMRRIKRWIDEPTNDHIIYLTTFADLRLIHGSIELFETFKAKFLQIVRYDPRTLRFLAEAALRQSPPLTLFKGFLVKKSGPHKGKIDLKNQGSQMIINLVRVLSLHAGVMKTNTWTRIAEIYERGLISQNEKESISQALDFLVRLRLKNNLIAIKEKREPDNFVDPNTLPLWHQKMLKESFEIVSELIKKTRKIFWWIN